MKTHCGSFLIDHEVPSPQVRLYRERSKKRERGREEEQINFNDNNQTRPSHCRLESQHQFSLFYCSKHKHYALSYSAFSIPNTSDFDFENHIY